jgi:small conductance mechanosensitive channel
VVALLVLLAFWALATVADRVLRGALDRARLDETAASFVRTLTRFTITVVAILTALGELGIDTTSILASLGVMGLTLGFAAQDTLGNVISGLFIFWDRPFVIGDLGWSPPTAACSPSRTAWLPA